MTPILSGAGKTRFSLPRVKTACQYPVKDKAECHIAAKLANSVLLTSENITKGGGDLPYGCISDRVTSGIHYIYWNENGAVISGDTKLRQVCQDQDQFEGK